MRTFRDGFLDKAHALRPRFVPWIAASDIVEEATIYLVNNLQMARDECLEKLDRPFFESLGKQGVIGVSQSADGDVPGLIPSEGA